MLAATKSALKASKVSSWSSANVFTIIEEDSHRSEYVVKTKSSRSQNLSISVHLQDV
jgi:hypothetical protein